ncbi:tetratricopeptide repeat protein [Acidisphaera sp. S103]|uniref:tetratricopeptide repeat protein n=1 Tax=Acidisphaera sp. S103 TaxID=1747223 RepID=UPI00131EC5E8|nr:tetratricopeptide repeat protein [Acidisphaera sp. S103]
MPRSPDIVARNRLVVPPVAAAFDGVEVLAKDASHFAAAGRLGEAAECWRTIVNRRPALAAAHNNLGSTLRLLGRDAEAVACFRRALDRDPYYPEACNNLGTVLCDLGQLKEGEAFLRRAIDLRPAYARAHCNLGKTLRERGEIGAARDCFETALRHVPDLAEAHLHLANVLLVEGRMPEGWASFEWRLRLPGSSSPQFGVPAWHGEPLGGRTLLLHASEGFGDIIQFCRFVPLLASAGRVVFQVPRSLRRLLTGFADGVSVIANDERPPAYDLHCDPLSIPCLLKTTLETIPARSPYLRADPDQVAYWQYRLGGLPGLRVGLAWAGNPTYGADRQRSIDPDRLAALAGVPGISFVSLQVGAERPPAGLVLFDATQQLTDFADTAALIAELDLVIGVDTAVVHLAGALGKPVWLLNRFDTDWRWMRDRSDSPWYPTLHQFRQPAPGDWHSVLQTVRHALHGRLPLPLSAADTAFQEASRHHQAKRLTEAERCYRDVLIHSPEHYPSLHQLGLIALERHEPETAIALFTRVAQRFPNDYGTINNLGNAYFAAGFPAKAITYYLDSLRLFPDDATTLCNLSIAQADTGEIAAAEVSCRRALAIQPDLADAHLSLGLTLLRTGRLAEGWPEFVWRRRISRHVVRSLPGIEWQGEPPGDRTVLLYSDEGYGDAIQCVRYLPLLGIRSIVLEVPPRLVRLFRPLLDVPEAGVTRVVAEGEALPSVHLHRPLLDLPGLVGTTLKTIPRDVPYLRADPVNAVQWHRRLAHLSGFRVGIAWAGNSAHLSDSKRSIPLARLLPLFTAFPDVNFISLQIGDARRQIDDLKDAAQLYDFTNDLKDFADTAALMEALDLVISVDTAVAHLAGALAVPVWLLNRFNSDWRWLQGRDDSPWYATLRQFRQSEFGDWDGVVSRVLAALRERLEGY